MANSKDPSKHKVTNNEDADDGASPAGNAHQSLPILQGSLPIRDIVSTRSSEADRTIPLPFRSCITDRPSDHIEDVEMSHDDVDSSSTMSSLNSISPSAQRDTRTIRAIKHISYLNDVFFPNSTINVDNDTHRTTKSTYLTLPSNTAQNTPPTRHSKCVIRLIPSDTVEAARALHLNNPQDKIAIHNFCHPTIPGGSYMTGGTGQEEDICLVTTLYPSLSSTLYPLKHEDVLWTPNVVVVRTLNHTGTGDSTPYDADAHFTIDVLSSAAVHQPDVVTAHRTTPDGATVEDSTYLNPVEHELQKDKIRYVLHAAVTHGVTRLVLGAFGCGAFRNPPHEVAQMTYEILVDDGSGKPETNFARYGLKEVVVAVLDLSSNQLVWNAFMDVFRQGHGLHAVGGVPVPASVQYTTFPPQDGDDSDDGQ